MNHPTRYYRGFRWRAERSVRWHFDGTVTPVPVLALGELGPGTDIDWGSLASNTSPALRLAFAIAFHDARRHDLEDPIAAAHSRYRVIERKIVRHLPVDRWRLTPETIQDVLIHAHESIIST